MSETNTVSEAAPKLDPETLVLRGNPTRVTRFRRGAIIAIAGVSSTAIAGIAVLALKPVSIKLPERSDEQVQLTQKPTSDALAGAPSGYGDVPRLGPPLPGDLGRPIVERQQELAVGDDGAEPQPSPGQSAIEQERERRLAELRAARQSPVLLQLQGLSSQPQPGTTVAAAEGEAPTAPSNRPAVDLEHDPNSQQHKIDFADKRDGADALNSHTLTNPASPYMLSAGSVIAASLVTGLNSDLPGLVTAQVTQNVYDSATGRLLLIPQGARLVGEYDSVVAFGQRRALVVWKRIVFPNTSSISIDNMPAADSSGHAGLADKVDRHTWQLLKGVALSTLLGVGAEVGLGASGNDLVQALREAAQQNGGRAGDQLVSKDLNVQPTIRVRPGWPLRILVSKDILLSPPAGPIDD